MKFVCDKETILKEITNANDFTAQRNSLTVLGSIYLSLEGNNLTVKSTDQKMGYVSCIEVSGEEDGTTTVMGTKFLDIIKTLPSGNIIFFEEDRLLKIKTESAKVDFKIVTADASSFPSIEIPSEDSFFNVSQRDLTDMINQVAFAVSDDESKFAMNGALLEKNEGSLTMVATDGRRLSYINRKIEDQIPEFSPITIPSKFLSIIKKNSSNEGNFGICITETSVYVKNRNFVIFSSLIKNEFPAYKRVIPQSLSRSCIVSRKDLEEAIKRISILVESKFKKIILDFDNNVLTVYTQNNDLGEGTEVLECKYEGEHAVSAMNFMFLLDPIRAMETEYVNISFSDPARPFVVKPEPERDYLHVIMPMNLN
ncbi:MAG: DNA polymerase III subunit beta [Sphaerochaetaceae bacterium]|nr:DNA polymerase III subunit beta [Sphaerochaetaceae bacterium]